jgi:uncharacterized protein
MRILITGASGLIGTRLVFQLFQKGYDVSVLGRAKKTGQVKSYVWDISKRIIEREALQNVDTIVHLAGAGVMDKRWNEKRKKEILESRILSTRLLYEELQKQGHPVKNFISASAIGYYGFDDPDRIFTETDPPGKDFLADVTKQWEGEATKIEDLSIRVVRMRIGIVLSKEGGVLPAMLTPIKFLAGAPFGSGNQFISWVHIDDLCNMFIKAIEDEHMQGAYNAVAPFPVTNKELTYAIAKLARKPILIPSVPNAALKVLLGEMADLVLKGSRVSSRKIEQAGYDIKFKKIEDALHDLIKV